MFTISAVYLRKIQGCPRRNTKKTLSFKTSFLYSVKLHRHFSIHVRFHHCEKGGLECKKSTITHKFNDTLKINDYRIKSKCHYIFLTVVAHFLLQKLECNREKPLYCGFSTVFNKKKRLTILSKWSVFFASVPQG